MESLRGPKLITIIGMHRSGTSALAGALHKLGADLGPESSWLPAATDNPLGFFEYAPLVNLNNKMLAVLGGTWSSPPALSPGWVDDDRLKELRDQAEWLSNEIPDEMVVKDPRLSLLHPLWETVINVPASILCLRHPVAVASSLLARNGLTAEQGLFLWFRYTAAAMLNRPDALVIEYESLIADPLPQLTRTVDHISLEASEKTVEIAAKTVYRSMAHHEGEELPRTPIGMMCSDLYDLMRSGGSLEANRALWIWARLATELPWAGPGDREINRVQGKIAELDREIARLTEANENLERRIRRLQTELQHALRAVDMASISETSDLLSSPNTDLR